MNQTFNIDVQVQLKSIQDLENELSKVNEELKKTEIGSDAFKKLSSEAQGLTKQLNKANAAAEGFTDEKKFQAADGAIKLMAGSLSGVVGTLGLIGVESEAFGEMEKKAASAIAVAMGVKDISEGFGQLNKALGLSGKAAQLFGSTTNKALIATGIGAFVVALGTIVAYWDEISAGVKKAAGSFPFIGKAIKAVQDAFDGLIERFRPLLERLGLIKTAEEKLAIQTQENAKIASEQTQRDLDLLRAKGAAQEEIHKKEMQLYDERIAAAADEAEKKKLEHEKEVARLKEETRVKKEQHDQQLKDQQEADAAFLEQLRLQREEEAELESELKDAFNAMMAEKEPEKDPLDDIQFIDENDLEDDPELVASLERNKRIVEGEKKKQEMLKDAREQGLANIIAIAGAEGDVGKAAFIAQQILAAKEMVLEASKTITFAKAAVAKSNIAVAEGTAQTAKIGFPQNIPMLLSYAVQAAGIISSIKSAVKATKGSYQVGTVPTTVVNAGANQVNINPDQVQQLTASNEQTVRAYVVGGDVRSNNEAEAKIQERRTLD